MNRRLPTLAILLGALLLAPFIGFGLATLSAGPGDVRMFALLMDWSSVMLAFFGAVHWGFALDEAAGQPANALAGTPAGQSTTALAGTPAPIAGATTTERWRLLLGILPAAIGWVALMIPLFAPRNLGLAVMIAGYIATIVVEDQGRRGGVVPRRYTWLRWAQSVVIVAMLVTVLVVRLLGAHLVFF